MPTKPLSRVRRFLWSLQVGQVGKWIFLASLVGFAAGWAAVGFSALLELFKERTLRGLAHIEGEGLEVLGQSAWLVLAIPALGGLVAGGLTKLFAPEAEGHGTDAVIRAFHRAGGVVRKRVILVKALASAFTIGTGGSAGQEGPVAQIGAGVGSAVGSFLHLSERDRRTFLLAGATAGIGAMFTAPLGGALLMAEVPYSKPEFESDTIIPCIISSIVAYETFTTVTGKSRAIELAPEVLRSLEFQNPTEMAVYVVLGILCAVVGWAYTKIFYGTHRLFKEQTRVPMPLRAAFGGLLVGVLALAVVPISPGNGILFGGYDLMKSAISGSFTLPAILILIAMKIMATSFTIGSGGSGGLFAPSLSIGALLGAAVGQGAAELFPALDLNPAAFALVGMGGFFAGIAKVPITAVIIVSEMTGSYELLAPLMLVAVVHMLLSTHWTIYEEQVPGLVDSPAHAGDYVVDVLERMRVDEVLDPDFMPILINQDITLREALKIVSTATQSYFPVVDHEEKLVGIFSLSDVRRIFRENVIEDLVIVRDFMSDRVATVLPNDSANSALRLLNKYHIHVIPVVDQEDPKRVIGFLNRNELGRAYDERLADLRQSRSSEAPDATAAS